MKKTLIVFILATAPWSVAFAGSSTASSASNSNASSIAIGNLSVPTANAGALAGAAVIGAPVTINPNTSTKLQVNQKFEAPDLSRAVPGSPGLILPQGSVPQIFGAFGGSVNENGIDLTLLYNEVCPSKAVRGYTLVDKTFDGESGKTSIVFSPNIEYAMTQKKISQGSWGSSSQEVQEVDLKIGKSGHFKCLGIMTVLAENKKAGSVPFSTILTDAKAFPFNEMSGYPKVLLLSYVNAIAATKGVENMGGGMGLSGGLSQFFNPFLGVLGAGVSTSSGITFPEAKTGATFLVLAEDPEGVFIDLSSKKPQQVAVAKPAPVAPPVRALIPPEMKQEAVGDKK